MKLVIMVAKMHVAMKRRYVFEDALVLGEPTRREAAAVAAPDEEEEEDSAMAAWFRVLLLVLVLLVFFLRFRWCWSRAAVSFSDSKTG